MKKLTAAAAALLILTSCASKKTDPSPQEPIGEVTTSAAKATSAPDKPSAETPEPTEPAPVECVEYAPSDFSPIEVNISIQNSKPQLKFTEYDVTGADLPSVSSQFSGMDDLDNVKTLRAIAIHDDVIFYAAEYKSDDHCEISSYDMKNRQSKVLYTFDNRHYISNIQYAGGSLWLYAYEYNDEDNTTRNLKHIYRLTETGELSDHFVDVINGDCHVNFIPTISDKLIFNVIYNSEGGRSVTYSGDPTTNTATKLLESANSNGGSPIYDGTEFVRTERIDGRIHAVTSRYDINTDLRSAKLVAANSNMVTFLRDGTDKVLLITYDLRTKERYELDVTSLGGVASAYQFGENIVIDNGVDGKLWCLTPSLGVTTELYSSQSEGVTYSGTDSGRIWQIDTNEVNESDLYFDLNELKEDTELTDEDKYRIWLIETDMFEEYEGSVILNIPSKVTIIELADH